MKPVMPIKYPAKKAQKISGFDLRMREAPPKWKVKLLKDILASREGTSFITEVDSQEYQWFVDMKRDGLVGGDWGTLGTLEDAIKQNRVIPVGGKSGFHRLFVPKKGKQYVEDYDAQTTYQGKTPETDQEWLAIMKDAPNSDIAVFRSRIAGGYPSAKAAEQVFQEREAEIAKTGQIRESEHTLWRYWSLADWRERFGMASFLFTAIPQELERKRLEVFSEPATRQVNEKPKTSNRVKTHHCPSALQLYSQPLSAQVSSGDWRR